VPVSDHRARRSHLGLAGKARAATVRPPRIPEIADPAWETADTGPMPVPANTVLLIENLLDTSHFYPLHDGNIGDDENSRIPVRLEQGTQDDSPYVGTIREVRGYKQPPYLEDYLEYDVVDRDHTHFMLSPAVTRVQNPYAGRSEPSRLAIDHQHAGGPEVQVRPEQIGGRALHADVPGGHRRGPLGSRKTAANVQLPGRRVFRGVPSAGSGAASRAPDPDPARAGRESPKAA